MNKFEIASLVLAMVAVVLFWVFGFSGKMNLSLASLIVAGCSCWSVLICRFTNWRRNRWLA